MLVTWKESDWWFTKSNKHFTCKKSPTTRKENLERILTSLGWNQAGLRSEGGGGGGRHKTGVTAKKNKVVVFLSSDHHSAGFERQFFSPSPIFFRLLPPLRSEVPGCNKPINKFRICKTKVVTKLLLRSKMKTFDLQ